MNQFAKGAQDIKWFAFSDIAQNKTAGIRFVIRIIFNNFSSREYMFNFFKRYSSYVTASLSASCNSIFSFKDLLMDLFEHFDTLYHKDLVLSRNSCWSVAGLGMKGTIKYLRNEEGDGFSTNVKRCPKCKSKKLEKLEGEVENNKIYLRKVKISGRHCGDGRCE